VVAEGVTEPSGAPVAVGRGTGVDVTVGGSEVAVTKLVGVDEGESSGVSDGVGEMGVGEVGVNEPGEGDMDGAGVSVDVTAVGDAVGEGWFGVSVGPKDVGVRVGMVCRWGSWPGVAHPARANAPSKIAAAISRVSRTRPESTCARPLIIGFPRS
jgi:hypothetical protein